MCICFASHIVICCLCMFHLHMSLLLCYIMLLCLYISFICIYIPSMHVLTSLWSVVVGTKAHASIGARFCYILLLITLKVRFRIKYRILIDFGLFWIYFPVWDILITCRWDVYLFSLFGNFFRSSHAKEVLAKFSVIPGVRKILKKI